MIVMKFGGTSVGDARAIASAAEIVRKAFVDEGEKVVVVVSAMSGVTDALIKGATTASRQDRETFLHIKGSLQEMHRRAIEELIKKEESRQALLKELEALLEDFENLCRSIFILGELTARGLDVVSSLGERIMARIMAASLNELGLTTEVVEATRLIVTDDNYGAASPLMDETRAKVLAVLLPSLEKSITPVVTGFIGATREGVITTLGRGGSDYTASILGHCLNSREIWIWTDVDGVMTADPRVVPEARTLPEISYAEAAELSFFGAKVLHPKTILPAVESGIPLRIKNTFNPTNPGTLIVKEARQNATTAKSITAIRDMSLITVEGRGMLGVPGVAAKVFSAVAREGINVLMISQSSSEQNICFVIRRDSTAQAIGALMEEFEMERARRNIDRIWAQENVAIVAVVGAGMRGTPGIAAKVFGALGRNGINVIAIAQGSSEYNISFVIEEKDVASAVRHIHSEFGLSRL
ncbi:MAG: aspartate kinase [Anaerolineae bacterium]